MNGTVISVLFLLGCYVVGSIPFGYLIGRLTAGIDVRKIGSGNIGATNVMRILGPLPALVVLFLDAAKGWLCVWLAMRLGFGMRQGPLEMVDRMGLDTVLIVMERLWREYGDVKYRPNALLKKLVRAGHKGVSTGRGFYFYDEQGNRLEPAVHGSTGGALL